MMTQLRRCTPFFLILFALLLAEAGIVTDYADARSRGGGRSFSRSTTQKAPSKAPSQVNQKSGQKSSFGRGLAGGLLGGALGGMLFGSLFGAGGSGMGILPLLILGVVGYFLYKRFAGRPRSSSSAGFQPPPLGKQNLSGGPFGQGQSPAPPVPPVQESFTLEDGFKEIRATDPGFDENYFVEIASDVFFKVQAGWMRRDLQSYRHLLGDKLAAEYEQHFAEMKAKGQLNKLESIAIRKVEITDCGSQNGEDFVTVLFTANLLDYTVDEQSGALVEGSMTEPVKFAEKWTWARPVRSEAWKLEGIEVVNG
ncbi:Tim44 domain-containing protein [Desulfogranum mediterraneum]|uniref:Tim44 domain-containing protein n=1 Tax=Desulfogranum mediterraneum TaxID=160661 RepID=UPI000403B8B6|nr:Tim44 domain-containing protein [Desulfogranum mediterraneum]